MANISLFTLDQAALPGSYADITPYFKINSSTYEIVEFYKSYFGIELDAENLKYGVYKPGYVCL